MTSEQKRKRLIFNISGWFFLSIILIGIAIFEWRSIQPNIILTIIFGLLGLGIFVFSLILLLNIEIILEQYNQNIRKFVNPDSSAEAQEEHELRIRERLKEAVKSKRSSYRKKFFISLIFSMIITFLIFEFTNDLSFILFFTLFMPAIAPPIYFSIYSFYSLESTVEDIIGMNQVSKWLDWWVTLFLINMALINNLNLSLLLFDLN